ncbi:3-methylaspartate ammonia-lyase, glutamate mutase [Candidatus Rhodobacter oscarellae]|uniref:3-methylaspartate ammonia-lyase, glutamate mutase n=1 Tax=Candidatus Rhodobacter oscarellae TaxID=1675527 RepID=A0A0J9E7N5_9RHOB|nr:acyclic terpene utilization AtuA family protein [Candidatus Rhodobacter lobularis]KMW58732.1 3-methylaspartate ammonia-lyase, glutamate mutase [Candidatus Rhodobacter lobularis]
MTRILIPSGALGLGYDKTALERGIAAKPDLIAIDGGSTDSGPSYLGRGVSKYSRASTKIEWAGLIDAAQRAGCPLVIGTAGTCGADSAVDWLVGITEEILRERGATLRVAILKSGQTEIKAAALAPLHPAPEIDDALLADCTNIVALAGAEQIQAALDTGADIVIAGRTTDTAIIAALPLQRGCHPGGAWHGAKIGECGALCATNPQSGVILVDFDAEGFTVTPLADGAHATPHTVSAHMLYENSDPFILYEPGGHLDVTGAHYDALDDRRVRVTGSQWVPGRYSVKLEGARRVGYQSVLLTLLRDRRYVENAPAWCDDILTKCRAKAEARLGTDAFEIELRIIGRDATLGALENRANGAVELGVMGIVTAQTPELVDEIGKMLNPYLLHHPLTPEEEQPTFAFPFSPAEIERGEIYEFCLNHVLPLEHPMDAFRLEVREIG